MPEHVILVMNGNNERLGNKSNIVYALFTDYQTCQPVFAEEKSVSVLPGSGTRDEKFVINEE